MVLLASHGWARAGNTRLLSPVCRSWECLLLSPFLGHAPSWLQADTAVISKAVTEQAYSQMRRSTLKVRLAALTVGCNSPLSTSHIAADGGCDADVGLPSSTGYLPVLHGGQGLACFANRLPGPVTVFCCVCCCALQLIQACSPVWCMCLPGGGSSSSSTQGTQSSTSLHHPVLQQFRLELAAASEVAKSGEGWATGLGGQLVASWCVVTLNHLVIQSMCACVSGSEREQGVADNPTACAGVC